MLSSGTQSDIGIVFVGPIVGFPPSLALTLDALAANGATVEGVDIFEGQRMKKSTWKILGLTALPRSHPRRITFANSYDEQRLFTIIRERIERLKVQGKKKIFLGGMSGGFIFAARMAEYPPDSG